MQIVHHKDYNLITVIIRKCVRFFASGFHDILVFNLIWLMGVCQRYVYWLMLCVYDNFWHSSNYKLQSIHRCGMFRTKWLFECGNMELLGSKLLFQNFTLWTKSILKILNLWNWIHMMCLLKMRVLSVTQSNPENRQTDTDRQTNRQTD